MSSDDLQGSVAGRIPLLAAAGTPGSNDRGDRDPVKLFRRCGSDEAVFLPSEDILKQTPDINTLDQPTEV
jgi:hypothetical protein